MELDMFEYKQIEMDKIRKTRQTKQKLLSLRFYRKSHADK